MADDIHRPVLYQQALEGLAIQPAGLYVDGTFGRGGHAAGILAGLGETGRLLAFDKDPQAIAVASQRFADDARFSIHQGGFAMLQDVLAARFGDETVRVNGLLLDLGVSSPQLDEAGRGFSFMAEGPLDMRMDSSSGMSAGEWLAEAEFDALCRVFWDFGEERYARRIARRIVEAREHQPLETTTQLAELIRGAVPRDNKSKKHPATRCFQAIRIFINQELAELEAVLPQALDVLAPGGRLAVISFHSLEDRMVKRFMRKHSRAADMPRGIPLREQDRMQPPLREVGRPLRADAAELAENPRARSAVLRIAERCYAH